MLKSIQIAILDMNNGRANEGIRGIKQAVGRFLSKEGIKGNYEIYDVRQKNEIPSIDRYDIFISSGGPGNPLPEGLPWEKSYFDFLEKVAQHNEREDDKKFLFLICHSFQLACIHWELGRVCSRKSTSFGVMPMHKTESGEQEVLFEGLDEPFWAVDSRDYQVIEPNKEAFQKIGAKLLALEKIRPHVDLERAMMAIRFSEEIFGTQFHPEADSEGMMRYFNQEEKRNMIIDNYGIEKFTTMLDHLDDEDKIRRTESIILPKFLDISYQKIKEQRFQFVEKNVY